MNQRQGTVNTILSVLQDNGIDYELNGPTAVKDVLTDSMKQQVRDILFTSFRNGDIEYKSSFQSKVDDDSELKKYISGLVNNWIRKAKEFNSGETYKAKNPGSRAGSTDPEVKEMRKLLSVTTDPEARTLIQEAINSKIAELKAEKNQVSIDVSNLPEHLKHLVG